MIVALWMRWRADRRLRWLALAGLWVVTAEAFGWWLVTQELELVVEQIRLIREAW